MLINCRLAACSGLIWSLAFGLTLALTPFREMERMAAVLLCFIALAGLVFSGWRLDRRVIVAPRVALCVLGFWMLVTLSAAWSVAPSLSLLYGGTLSVLPATILGLIFAQEDARNQFLRMAVWGTGMIVAGLSLWALVQVFVLPEFLVRGQVRHPFANPNAFAAMLDLAFFTGLGLFFQSDNRKIRMTLIAGLFLTGAALAAIASQAATLTLIVCLVSAMFLTRHEIRFSQAKIIFGLLVSIVMAGVVMAMIPDKTDIVSRLATLGDGGMNSWQNRIDIWRGTILLIAEHPFLGTGYRTFFLMYPSVRLPSETYSGGYMAHSDPLQLWAEMGIAGPIFFYMIGFMILARFIAWWRDGSRSIMPVFLLCGCVAFILHAHVDFLLYTMPTSMMFAMVLGVLLILTKRPGEMESVPLSFTMRWPDRVRGAALAVPVAVLMFVFMSLMLAEHYTARAQSFAKVGDMQGFGNAVNIANRMGSGMTERPYLMAAAIPLGILKSKAGTMTLEEQQTLFHQIDGMLSKALIRNSRSATAWYHRGEMIELLNPSILSDTAFSAEDCFKRALMIDPLYLPARQSLAQSYRRKGLEPQALDVLAAGLRWPYPIFDPISYYSETEALAGQLNRLDITRIIAEVRPVHMNRVQRSIKQREALADLIAP